MALRKSDTSSIYDDNAPEWRTSLETDDTSTPGKESDGLSEVSENNDSNSKNNTSSPSELKKAENSVDSDSSDASSNDGGGEPASNWKNNVKAKRKAIGNVRIATKKKLLIAGSGAGVVMLLMLIVIFLGNTKIIGLAEQITAYNMARSARTFRQSMSQNTAESIEAEAINDGRFSSLKTRFEESKIKAGIDKYNTYKPAKVLENLESDLKPVFEKGPYSKLLGRETEVFTGWDYKGAFIEKADTRFYTPIANYKEKLRLSSELNAILEQESHGANGLVRTSAVSGFLEKRGLGKLRFWDKAMLKKMTPDSVEAITAQQAVSKSSTPASACAVEKVCNAVEAAKKSEDDILATAGNKTQEQLDNEVSEASTVAIKESLSGGAATALQYTSLVYGVAMPLCLIFEGSVESSKDTTNNTENALMANYFTVRTAADEMKKGGDATSQLAIKGLSNKIGDMSGSIPSIRAAGIDVDPNTQINPSALPQASSVGTFSLLNVLFDDSGIPSSFIEKTTEDANSVCSVVTNVWTGLGLTVAELAATLLLPGAGSVAKEGAQEGALAGMKLLLDRTFTDIAVKAGLEEGLGSVSKLTAGRIVAKAGGKLFAKVIVKTGAQVAAVLTLTELAHLAVLKHMNSGNNGLATDASFVNQVDMGANLYAQGVNRTVMYGKPLPQADLADSKIADASYTKSINQRQSVKDRYIAIANPSSFITKMAMSLNLFNKRQISNFGSTFAGMMSSMLTAPRSLLATIGLSRVHAAPSISGAGDYNIIQWGWTKEEEALIDQNVDYSPLQNELILDQSGKAKEIEDKYSQCYTLTDGELFANVPHLIQRATTGEILENAGDCSPNSLGLKNKTYGDLVMRWRLSKRNQNVLQHLTEIQNAQ